MGRKTKLAHKTLWALEDILYQCKKCEYHWEKALEQLEIQKQPPEPTTTAYLAHIRHELAIIQRIAIDARNGEYNEIGVIDKKPE